MKKSLTILLITISLACHAQQFRYGFQITPLLNWWNLQGDLYDPIEKRIGVQYGMLLDQTLGSMEHFAITSGITLNYTQGGMSSADDKEKPGEAKDWQARAQYIEIPLSLRVRSSQMHGLTFYGQVGASYASAIRARGDYTINGRREDSDINYLDKEDNNGMSYLPNNASLLFGAGTEIALTETASLVIGLFFENGLLDVFQDNNVKYDVLQQQFGITIGGLF